MNSRVSIPWSEVEGAVFLIGLAIVAWQGWWWPGILVVLAITGLVEGFSRQQKNSDGERTKKRRRGVDTAQASELAQATPSSAEPALALPDRCPNCGGNIDSNNVDRTANRVGCPYCGTRLTAAAASAA